MAARFSLRRNTFCRHYYSEISDEERQLGDITSSHKNGETEINITFIELCDINKDSSKSHCVSLRRKEIFLDK